MAKRINFDNTVEDQKRCNPGPNVVFDNRKNSPVKFGQYLINYNREGSLGCGPGKYPMYRDGKYCCEDNIMNDQDLFDYINSLLQSATEMSDSMFQSNAENISFLINECRDHLIDKNPSLIDKLKIPEGYDNINDWYMDKYDKAPDRKTDREIPPEMLADPSQYQRLAGRSMNEHYANREYRRNLLREANKQLSPGYNPRPPFRPGGGQYRLEVPYIPDEPIIRNRKRDENENEKNDKKGKKGGRKGKTYNKKNKRKKTTKRKTRI